MTDDVSINFSESEVRDIFEAWKRYKKSRGYRKLSSFIMLACEDYVMREEEK